MITNVGKDIISKYLLGQTPSYASYIAVGCGPQPLERYVGGPKPDYSTKTELDFEMFRVPISSRGIINENGERQIVLTAELPTEERYEITEVGLYSAGINQLVGSTDSRNILSFAQSENWKIDGTNTLNFVSESLEDSGYPNIIRDSFDVDGELTELDIFQTNANNPIFNNETRYITNERSRFLNNMIIIRGNSSTFTGTTGSLVPEGTFIQLSGTSADFSKNSTSDELRIAFSILDKDGTSSDIGTNKVAARIVVEFSTSTINNAYARFEARVDHVNDDSSFDFDKNRYFVVSKKLNELNITSGFTWKSVDTVKIYAQVLTGAVTANTVSDQYYIALDALRLENKNSLNPLYGLVGYSIVRNLDKLPIIKNLNTSNYIEFRFVLDAE